ncbi:MAG: molecular chaperone Tir [Spirulina sp. SIO3F2]|nr:molecular chaperone Tir [Spirulina sp. SIO3F2]
MQFLPLSEFQNQDTQLTTRQREVLLLFLLGAEDDEIARQLYVTNDTVRRHLSDICKRFSPDDEQRFNRAQLVAHYARYRPELFRDSLLYAQSTLDLVLSYHQDAPPEQAIAHPLAQALRTVCPNCLYADKNLRMISGGRKQIQDALRHTKALLVLFSPTSDEETITEEVRLATAERLADTPCQVIMVQIDRPVQSMNHDLRYYLRGAQILTCLSSQDSAPLIRQIVERLQNQPLISSPPTPLVSTPAIAPPATDETVLPPVPIAEPELPTGTVTLTSAFYVERPGVDDRCLEEIQKPSALIRIKAPRQMGKTSLLARVLHQAQDWGCTTVVLSLQLAERDRFESLDTFLFWLCAQITHRLQQPITQLKDYWAENTILGSKTACTDYLETHILNQIPEQLVLGLDEVDVVFEYGKIASDFFGLLRAWHEQAKSYEIWQKLSLVVVHSTEAYVSLPTTQSPFNVGLPIELPEFDASQVQALAQRHGLDWDATAVQQLMEMVGGHPYLVRLALYHIARGEGSLPQLLADAPTDSGLYSDHLRRLLWTLEQYPELGQAAAAVMAAPKPLALDPTVTFQLRGLGLVRSHGHQVASRCSLYRQYLQTHLAKL